MKFYLVRTIHSYGQAYIMEKSSEKGKGGKAGTSQGKEGTEELLPKIILLIALVFLFNEYPSTYGILGRNTWPEGKIL